MSETAATANDTPPGHISPRLPFAAKALVSIITVTLSAVAVWGAWDYGGGFRETKLVTAYVILAAIALGLIASLTLPRESSRPAKAVLFAFLAWGGGWCQTLELGESTVTTISPASADAYRNWVPDEIASEAAAAGVTDPVPATPRPRHPISVSPTHTRMALAVPLLFAAALWLASICFSVGRLGVVFLVSAAVAGGLFSFFGLADALRLARDLAPELRQRLIITPVGADGPFGPFVNNNNAAGYLNLTLGCALGLLTLVSADSSRRPQSKRESSASLGPSILLRHWQVVACALVIILNVAGILGSGSRGGFLGLVAGVFVLAIGSLRGRPKLRRLTASVAVVVFAGLILDRLGILNRTGIRLRSLVEGQALGDPRLAHWRDSLDAAFSHLPAGAGLGTYRYAYLPFQSTGGEYWFVNADGMPVEWLLEGGIWLPFCVVAGLIFVVRDLRRLAARSDELPAERAAIARGMVTTGTFVVPSLLVSQTFDFGILQPPLLISFACLCGGLTCLARPLRHRTQVSEGYRGGPRKWFEICGRLVIAVSLAIGLAIAAGDLRLGSAVQQAQFRQAKRQRVPLLERSSLDKDIMLLQDILAKSPRQTEARLLLSQLWVEQQRQLGARFLEESEAAPVADLPRWVAPATLRRAARNDSRPPPQAFADLMLPPQDLQAWRRARGQAAAGLWLCPLSVVARVRLIELDMVSEGGDLATPKLLETAGKLRRRNRRVLDRLQVLADAFPGGETADDIRQLRAELKASAGRRPAGR